jgi:hypothetical protein
MPRHAVVWVHKKAFNVLKSLCMCEYVRKNICDCVSFFVTHKPRFVLVLGFNGLSATGAIGTSIGDIANKHPTYFLPANYVFR